MRFADLPTGPLRLCAYAAGDPEIAQPACHQTVGDGGGGVCGGRPPHDLQARQADQQAALRGGPHRGPRARPGQRRQGQLRAAARQPDARQHGQRYAVVECERFRWLVARRHPEVREDAGAGAGTAEPGRARRGRVPWCDRRVRGAGGRESRTGPRGPGRRRRHAAPGDASRVQHTARQHAGRGDDHAGREGQCARRVGEQGHELQRCDHARTERESRRRHAVGRRLRERGERRGNVRGLEHRQGGERLYPDGDVGTAR